MVAVRSSTGVGRRKSRIHYGILGAAAVLAVSQFAAADNFLWTGAASNSWNLADLNWNNTTIPTNGVPWTNNPTTTTPNSATFSLATPPLAITVDDAISVGAISFTTGNWNINAGTGSLSFGDVGTIAITSAGLANAIGATIQDTGAAATSVSVAGAGGVLTLSGANTYSGGTTLTSGELQIGGLGNVGSGNITFSGGFLGITGTALTTIDGRIANPTTFAGGFDITDPTNVFTLNTALGGTDFTKFGPGTLLLTAALTNTGATNVSGGLLQIGTLGQLSASSILNVNSGVTAPAAGVLDLNGTSQTVGGLSGNTGTFVGKITNNLAASNSVLTVNAAAGQTYSGVLADGTGTLALTKSGVGTLTLAGANTYSGLTKVNGGVLSVSSDANLGTGNINLDGGTLQLATNNFALSSSRTISLGSTAGTGGTLNVFTSTNPVPGNIVTFGGTITDGSGGNNSLTKTGNGVLVLTSANTYTGQTIITGVNVSGTSIGTGVTAALEVTADGALGAANNNDINAGTIVGITGTAGSLVFAGGVQYNSLEKVRIDDGAFILGALRGTGGNNLFAGNIVLNSTTSGAYAKNVVFLGVDAGSSLTLTGTISETVAGEHLLMDGGGTLILDNAATQTGATNVSFLPSAFNSAPGSSGNNATSGGGLLLPAGTLVLGRSASGTFGSVLTSSLVNIGSTGALVIDDTTKTAGDPVSIARMDPNKVIDLSQGATLTINGSANANTVDVFGILTAGGNGTSNNGSGTTAAQKASGAGDVAVIINPGAGHTSTLQLTSLNRFTGSAGTGGTILFEGPNFGQATGLNVAQVLLTGAPQLSGTALAFSGLGTTAASIIPYAFVHDTSSSANVTTLATFDASGIGIRGLNEATETTTTFTSNKNFLVAAGTTNVTATATGSGSIIKSLTMHGNGAILGGTGIVTVFQAFGDQGTVLSTGTGNVINVPTLGFANANYTAEEALFYVEGDLTVNSQIGSSNFPNGAGLTKSGSGELILTNTANTFGGTSNLSPIRINAGTLTISSVFNLRPNNSNPYFADIYNGTLKVTGGGVVDFAPSPTAVTGATVGGITLAINRGDSGSDPAASFINVAAGTTLRLGIFQTGGGAAVAGVTKIGAGTLYLTDVDPGSAIGTSYLKQGSLTLGDNSVETAGAPTKFGTYQTYGNLIASPHASINIDSTHGSGTALVRLGSAFLNSTTLTDTGNSANSTIDRIRNTVSLSSGGSSITVTPGAGQTSELRMGTLARVAGATLTLTGSKVGSATGANVSQVRISSIPISISGLTTTAATPLPFAIVVDTQAGTTLFATYDAGVADADTATGSIRSLTSGEMVADAFTAGQNIRLTTSNSTGTLSIQSLTLQNTGTTTDIANSGTLTVTSGGVLSTGTAGNTITGGTLAFGGAEGIFHAVANLGVSSNITGTAGLTKADGGNLTLSGTNTYTGASTWINGGKLIVSSDANLGDASVSVTLNPGGSLEVAGAGLNIASTRGIVLNGDASSGIIVDAADSSFSSSGVVSGTGDLNVSGLGTLALSRGNTFTGNINVTGGATLSVNGAPALGLGTGPIVLDGSTMNATSNLTVDPTRQIRLGSANATPGSGTLDAASGATLTYNGVIVDNGTAGDTLFKGTGAGTVSLGGANLYTGGTVVSGGTFLVNNTTGSGTGSGNVTLNGGILGGNGTISGAVIAGAAAHTIAPSATLAPTAASTLNMSSLSTNSHTTLSFNLIARNTAGGGSDLINVTAANGLSITGGTLNIANSPVGPNSLGYYRAIGYSGTIQGTGYTSVLLPPATAGNIVYTLDVAHDANFIDIHRGFQGDANDDGSVTFADFVALSNHFGLANAGWGGGDFNGDGTTNFADFVVLSNHFGLTVGGGSLVASADDFAEFAAGAQALFGGAAPVPEPASLMLLGLGAASLIARRRRRA